MNKPVTPTDLVTPKVTTGPIAGSRKVYSTPETAPDLRVPLREIALSDPAEEPVRVYDPSGPYTDPDAAIDVEAGLLRPRIDWVRERGCVEEYEGRAVQSVDNGNVSGAHLARAFPKTPRPLRAKSAGAGDSTSPSPLGGEGGAAPAPPGGRAPALRASAAAPIPDPSPQ
ncbi:MAG: phosphomethylpyrimidine synthase ThiC, partial [Rhodoplanes sp.]